MSIGTNGALGDTGLHAARRHMIHNQIMARGVRDQRVLDAVDAVPRELFVPQAMREMAYDDRALPIDEEQTISQPYIVAYMTAKLEVEPDHNVLEIGTGSGYQTAILARLAKTVHTIERFESLHRTAKAVLGTMAITNVQFHVGDGTLGWPESAPFDRIIVTAAAPHVPKPLIDQLVLGGKLVIPVGDAAQQTLLQVTKRLGRTVEIPLIACRFVKLIGQAGWD